MSPRARLFLLVGYCSKENCGLNSSNLKQVSKSKVKSTTCLTTSTTESESQEQQTSFPIFDKNTLPLERKKKFKDRRAGTYVDIRKRYPPFKVDRDLFFLCDYPDPQDNDNKPCNKFYGLEKSIYAHYSRIHNKQNNPNRLRIQEKEEQKQFVLFSRKIIKVVKCKGFRSHKKTYLTIPIQKQSALFEF